MPKVKSNIEIYCDVARKLGLQVTYLRNEPGKRTLSITNGKRTMIAGTRDPGFYPNSHRFNSYISRSKILSQKVLSDLGYKTIKTVSIACGDYPSKVSLKTHLKKQKLAFPILFKPDTGHRGKGISIIENTVELYKEAEKNYTKGRDFLLQPILDQTEYRILVVNDEVLLVHSKHNPTVIGDGKTPLRTLLNAIPAAKKDKIYIARQYKLRALKPSSILEKGDTFEYHLTKKPTTDFYTTADTPSALKKWGRQLAHAIGAPVVGIDVFLDGPFTKPDSYTIIELNSNPGFEYLIPYCGDTETPYMICRKVLTDYFSLK